MAGVGLQPDRDTQRLAGQSLRVDVPRPLITSRAGEERVVAIVGDGAVATLTTEMISQQFGLECLR